MSLVSMLAFILTVVASISIVTAIIFLGWYLIWKAFLSKFRLVRELFGQGDAAAAKRQHQEQAPVANNDDGVEAEQAQQQQARQRKLRKD